MNPEDIEGKIENGTPVDKNVDKNHNVIDRQNLDGKLSSIPHVNIALGGNKESVPLTIEGKHNIIGRNILLLSQ